MLSSSIIISKNSLKSQSNEDQVVPALGMKKAIDFNTVNDDDYDGGRQASLDSGVAAGLAEGS